MACGICGQSGHNARTCGRGGSGSSGPPSSSAYGSSSSGSHHCSQCGQSGHNIRTCPNGSYPSVPMSNPYTTPAWSASAESSSSSSSTHHCSNCGQSGHNIRTCTYSPPAPASTYHCGNCGKAGHNSRSCTVGKSAPVTRIASLSSSSPSSSSGTNSESSYKCGNCGKAGHNSRTCPVIKASSFAASGSGESSHHCSNCGKTGHNRLTCSSGSTSSNKCSTCGRTGHNSRSCTQSQTCSVCRKSGHTDATCSLSSAPKCERCLKKGHDVSSCPLKCSKCYKPGHDSKDCPLSMVDCKHCSTVHAKGKCQYKVPHVKLEKTGEKDKTDAAHIFAREIANEVLKHKKGRPYNEQDRKDIAKTLAQAFNLRLKSVPGNRKTDREMDKQIMEAMVDDVPLNAATFQRAQRQLRVLKEMEDDLPEGFYNTAERLYSKLYKKNGSGKLSVTDDMRASGMVGGYESKQGDFPPDYDELVALEAMRDFADQEETEEFHHDPEFKVAYDAFAEDPVVDVMPLCSKCNKPTAVFFEDDLCENCDKEARKGLCTTPDCNFYANDPMSGKCSVHRPKIQKCIVADCDFFANAGSTGCSVHKNYRPSPSFF